MRLGISSPLRHANPEEWGRRMKDIGARAVVFPVDFRADDALIARYEKAAHENDLLIAEVGVWKNPLASDEKTRAEAFAYAVGQLQLAERVGARCCVNIVGTTGVRWDGAYKENFTQEMFQNVVKSLQTIIDAVKPTQTFYSIEPMPWMIPLDPDEYVKLLAAVDRKGFAVHMDICNWITSPQKYFFSENFIEEAFAKLGRHIRSCHLKNVQLADEFTFRLIETDCAGGSLDLEAYIRAADQIDRDMPMIIEHLQDDGEYLKSMAYARKRFGI